MKTITIFRVLTVVADKLDVAAQDDLMAVLRRDSDVRDKELQALQERIDQLETTFTRVAIAIGIDESIASSLLSTHDKQHGAGDA